MGTLTLLRNVLGIPKPQVPGMAVVAPNTLPPRVEIFGPRGIRRMLRMLWHMTHTRSQFPYVVHELLFPGEQPSVPADVPEHGADEADVRREETASASGGTFGATIWAIGEASSTSRRRADITAGVPS